MLPNLSPHPYNPTPMKTSDYVWLIIIFAIIGTAVWVLTNPDYPIRPGLDLQGGLQVLLEADLPPDVEVTAEQMQTTRQIISRRIDGLGVTEPLVQAGGDRRIVIELPGLEDRNEAIALVQGTALLEFIDTGYEYLPPDLCVRTSENQGRPSPCEANLPEGVEAPTFNTILTGANLIAASVQSNPMGNQNLVAFTLDEEGGRIFGEYTASHIGQFLTIVLDKQVVSSPQIESMIQREGSITGNFTLEEAQTLALQLRYGSLPIPLRVEGVRQVGATLGAQSITSSIQAGAIGLMVVLIFMAVYYRLPGGLADIALIIYALLNFAAFQVLGVTITLPAITGFLLSTGMAVDANILVFERMKEELRHGVPVTEAVNMGFDRAWSSIRDSNIATLVVCMILLLFGRSFGASVVQGFAWTLMIGILISMFTALIVTRTLMRLFVVQLMGNFLETRKKWLGV
jgi:protein-export membrane protein SecD